MVFARDVREIQCFVTLTIRADAHVVRAVHLEEPEGVKCRGGGIAVMAVVFNVIMRTNRLRVTVVCRMVCTRYGHVMWAVALRQALNAIRTVIRRCVAMVYVKKVAVP